jgi:tyrosinase
VVKAEYAVPQLVARSAPTWDGSVADLFSEPYWISEAERIPVASSWQRSMVPYGLDIYDYESVRKMAPTVYEHLASHAMPLTSNPAHLWPYDAVETLRTWIEQGTRRDDSEPLRDGPRLPRARRARLKVRRNIVDLEPSELDAYRERIEEMGATVSPPTPRWERVAGLHGDWCLHYQEAFLPWHRAHLLWFEHQVGMPIPYWDFMSPRAVEDGDPAAGLPGAFRDCDYVAPSTGETRPNPLRFAVAAGGRSKACAKGGDTHGDCRYVQRFPWLYTSGEDSREKRLGWLAMLATFQQQVAFAMRFSRFSAPEGDPGYPWANLPSFKPPQPDRLYPHRTDFDGLYEQAHDNLHGWIGPDMADNYFTSYDPLFWSLHSGIDRVFERWLRERPAAQFTSGFALRPFVGDRAHDIDLVDPDSFLYTTIGDMARDCRSLGYDYEALVESEVSPGRPLAPVASIPAKEEGPRLYVLFPDSRCVHDSFTIDVFLGLASPSTADVRDGSAEHFVGRLTRLGMGVEDDKGRCVARGVTRVLDASATARHLGIEPGEAVDVRVLVTHLHSGRVLGEDELASMPGFTPVAVWGREQPSHETDRSKPCC